MFVKLNVSWFYLSMNSYWNNIFFLAKVTKVCYPKSANALFCRVTPELKLLWNFPGNPAVHRYKLYGYYRSQKSDRMDRVVDLESLAPHRYRFESHQGLRIFHVSYPARLGNVGGSTQLPARTWNNARRGTCGLHSPVKRECRHITCTVLVRRKTQPKTIHMDI